MTLMVNKLNFTILMMALIQVMLLGIILVTATSNAEAADGDENLLKLLQLKLNSKIAGVTISQDATTLAKLDIQMQQLQEKLVK